MYFILGLNIEKVSKISYKMPRKSKVAKPGVRKYGVKSNYTPGTLEEALNQVRSGALTRMEAAKKYQIPPVTLFYKLKQQHTRSIGRPVALSKTEEDSFKAHLLVLSELGIPISMLDFRSIVKKYLDSNDKTIKQFHNNMPGYEWGTLFLERHPDLKIKVAHNIPRKRAQVNREQVEAFFANLTKEMEGVPPENIFNMDESGFHDDPGKKKLLFGRDCRHPEIIKNATKSCYTVVFCVNAAGEIENEQVDDLRDGMFCVFNDEGSLFPGRIQKVCNEDVTVQVLQKKYLGGWAWYSRNEKCVIKKSNIISIIKEHQITRKNHKFFIEDDILFKEWGE